MKVAFEALRKFFGKHKGEAELASFRLLFDKFRDLLDLNNRVLELMADMGDKLSGDYIFDIRYIEESISKLENLVQRIIADLNALSENRYSGLNDAFNRIRRRVRTELKPSQHPSNRNLVIPLSRINLDGIDLVGGKMATLGEIRSKLGLQVPEGFVITTNAYRTFIAQPKMSMAFSRAYKDLEAGADPQMVSEYIRKAVNEAIIPEQLRKAIKEAAKRLQAQGHSRFAVRSSALYEDSLLSFAGQYQSFLQVTADSLADRYRRVVASLFSPEAIVYRQENGLSHEDAAMGVGVLAMVEPKISGVMYSRDPQEAGEDVILISAAWGLARTVVEGRSGTDYYKVERGAYSGRVLEEKIGKKTIQLLPDDQVGEREFEIPADLQCLPCLSREQLQLLLEIARQLEFFFRNPQDIEWSIDRTGKPVILQSRPLQVYTGKKIAPGKISAATAACRRLMEDAGMVACRGIGAGRVIQIFSEADFERFRRGAVLVAPSTSPKLAQLIPLASAIVTDIGTPTGHMATVAREYRVPTLVDTGHATQCLLEGSEVTVDAEERVIYEGVVKELLDFQTLIEQPFADTREFRLLRRLFKKVSPLSLTDPTSSEFTPEKCRTYHDITRFCHEMAVKEFIDLHLRGGRLRQIPLYRLSLPIPIGLSLIDIGEGIVPEGNRRTLKTEQICSLPLKALLNGLLTEGIWRTDPVDLDFRSFMTSFTRTSSIDVMNPRDARNLAVVSKDYLNLNVRLGYHFNMIDSLMSDNRNENYAYFRFLGGVTDFSRRSRRAKFLGEVLNRFDFMVEITGDLIVARIRKLNLPMMESRLEMLGRLIGFSRQLDVMMTSDNAVDKYVNEFLESSPLPGRFSQ